MANKTLKTIRFPGLTDTYTVPQVENGANNNVAVLDGAGNVKDSSIELSKVAKIDDVNELISGKLDANKLPEAIDDALAQAKASGEFDGADGITPTIGANGNWYLGNADTGKPSRGATGDTGPQGPKGDMPPIAQTTGDSETAVMSQKATTVEINALKSDLSNKVDKLTIPSYWQNAMDTAIVSAKAKQDLAGNKCINFIMFSDMHSMTGSNQYIENIGKLAEYASEKLNIPIVAMLGDHISSSTARSVAEMKQDAEECMNILSPIPYQKSINVLGNHDINGGTGYLTSLTQAEIYNILLRKESQDLNRVWDDDGRYFYLDNKPQKTRFICLYTNWWDNSIISENTVSLRYQDSFGFGQKQLDFLVNALSSAEEDWNIVILEHTPPCTYSGTNVYNWRDVDVFRGIINAYKERTAYAGSYTGESEWMNVSINCDFTNVKGNIVAIFCGHRHKDEIYTEGNQSTGVKVPVITVTCSANAPYDANPQTRTVETDSETALDIVTIDVESHNIYMTRIGSVGADRNTNYTVYSPAPLFTNLADPTSEDWKDDIRINSSGVEKACVGNHITNFIKANITTSPSTGDVIRIKGLGIMAEKLPDNVNGMSVAFYDANKTFKLNLALSTFTKFYTDEGNGIIAYRPYDLADVTGECYFRFNGAYTDGSADNVVITVNEEIS